MFLKRLLSFLMVLALMLALVACDEADRATDKKDRSNTESDAPVWETESKDSSEPPSVTPLLYKVTDGEGDVLWLFGSIHLGEEYFYPLPAYVTDAFDGADSLAVEFDVLAFEKDYSAQMAVLKPMIYRDGTTISDHISSDLYSRAKEALEELKVYNSMLDYYCPVLWSNMIESALYTELGMDADLGIDVHMINRAYDQDKKVLDIESALSQYQMLGSFSLDLQIMLLESALESAEDPSRAADDMEQLVQCWISGDEARLVEILTTETTGMTDREEALYAEYTEAMMTDRNLHMATFAQNALDSDEEVFLCVGAAHIVGEGGLADLLAQRGYTVEKVSP